MHRYSARAPSGLSAPVPWTPVASLRGLSPGVPELLVVLLIVLLVLGPKRLPGLGRQLGGAWRELRDGVRGHGADKAVEPPADRDVEDEEDVLHGEVVPERRR